MDSHLIKGKKLLILSGIAAQIKVVEAAKELGVYTIVTDYLEPDASPAKKVANEYWMVSYGDTDSLEKLCKENQVDGILACYHESAQIPYFRLCKRLGFPCYAEMNQFELLTNKRMFKQLCREHGVGTIEEFNEEDVISGNVSYPVMVKPSDRCGSKGQAICNNHDELLKAIKEAKHESITGDFIIEKYIANRNSFQATYFFINGQPFLIRTTDGYKGTVEQSLDRVALCSISPSIYTEEYISSANQSFIEMLKSIGVKDGPVMAQGFYDDGEFRFYDPGRRFPGTDYETVYKKLFDIDLMKMMVIFALTGNMPTADIRDKNVFIKGSKVVVFFPTIKTGIIGTIEGIDELRNNPRIYMVQQKHVEGTVLNQPNTVSQRILEVDFTTHSISDAKEIIQEIQKTIRVTNDKGEDMIDSPFDIDRLIDLDSD